jgi:hypothetical protein
LLWRLTHNYSPNATPLYIVGVQRSGTNMLLGAFAKAPEAEIHNESMASRAFADWALRSDDIVRSLVQSSRHRCIVFKPLVDSHRVVHLMEHLGAPSPGRSIWIYRDYADQGRSVRAKWSETTGQVGRRIAAGYRGRETGGLSEELLALATRFDSAAMTPASGAALFWYLRNALFFDLGLDRRPDVALVAYNRFVAEPERFMTRLCEFVEIPFRREMVSGVARRPPPTREALDVDPELRSLCDDLRQRLDDELDRRLVAGMVVGRPDSADGLSPVVH